MPDDDRRLDNTTPEEAEADGWVHTETLEGLWELVAKAVNERSRIMKSTKRLAVPGGWLYQVTTEGPRGYAESLTFVPTWPNPRPRLPIARVLAAGAGDDE